MQLLSIDVGMKNLAYCLFYIKDNKYSILDWNIINLCNEENRKCMMNKKNNTHCTNIARFYKKDIYVCKLHSKHMNFKVPLNNWKPNSLKKNSKVDLMCIANKMNIPYNGEKKTQVYNMICDEMEKNYLNFVPTVNANTISLFEYGKNIKEKFNHFFNYDKIDLVILENQIGPLALRMKSLQGMIMQHFIEKNIQSVIEVSSANKLKKFMDTKKSTYSERKKKSINITTEFLHKLNNNKYTGLFLNHTKKDDLADCFLQGIWYLDNNNLVDNNIINNII